MTGCDRSDSGVCSEHGTLNNDVKWLRNIVFIGFSMVLSAVVYFNVTLQTSMEKIHRDISDISILIAGKSAAHESELMLQDFRLASIEEKCCDTL